MRHHLTSAACVLMLVGCAASAAAQGSPLPPRDRPTGPPPMPVGTGIIRGRVVDAQTGGAVPRAKVRLNWIGPGIQRAPVTTDDTGGFVFTGLPAGGFTLTVDKTTYLSARYPEGGQTMRTSSKPLTLAAGQAIDNVSVTLYHGSAITGRVVDARGDPLDFAQVQALRLPKSGRGRPQQAGMGSTNDLGEFRLARLQPGKYLVLVMPQRRDMFVGPNMAPEVVVEPQPIATYYPGVLAIDQAQPITVERGASSTGVEITLIDGVISQVSGTLVDGAGQPVTRGGMISVRPIIKDVPGSGLGASGTSSRPDGTFQLKLPPGEYELEGRVMQMGPGGPTSSSEQLGSVRLTVSGDVTGVTIPIGPGATVTGRIVFDGTEQLPTVSTNANGPGRVMFMSPDGPGCRSGRSDVAADWTFSVEGVFGTCTARFNGGLGRWTVKAITHDGKDLMDRPMRFEQGQQLKDVEVILTDKRTELTLHVADEHGTPTREYVAVLFSTDKARWTEGSRYLRTYMPPSEQMLSMMPSGSSASGMTFTTTIVNGVVVGGVVGGVTGNGGSAFATSVGPIAAPGGTNPRKEQITNMPAGEYFIVALDDIDIESTRDAETLDQLSRGATRVRLADGVPVDLNLHRLTLQPSR